MKNYTALFVAGVVTIATLAASKTIASTESGPMETADALESKARLALLTAQKERQVGNYEAAVEAVLDYLRKNPNRDHYLLRYALGADLARANRPDDALEHYQACIRLEPRFDQGWLNLGELAYNLGKYDLAATALAEGFERQDEKNPQVLYYAAAAHIVNNAPAKAVPHLKRMISETLGRPKLEYFRALISSAIELEDRELGNATAESLFTTMGGEAAAWELGYQYYAGTEQWHQAAMALTITGYLRPLTRSEQTQLGDLFSVIDVPAEASRHYEAAYADSAS